MEFDDFSDLVFRVGQSTIKEMEIFHLSQREVQIGIFNNQVDKYIVSDSSGVSLRGVAGKGMGYSYTERMDEESARLIIDEVIENGEYTDNTDVAPFSIPSEDTDRLYESTQNTDELSVEEKIEIMLELEKAALSIDKRVGKTQTCSYEEFSLKREIRNSKGLSLSDRSEGGYVYLSVVANDGDDIRTGSSMFLFRNPKEIEIVKIAKEAVEEAVSLLGGRPVESGKYNIILKNNVFGDMLEGFMPAFTGENVQKGLSFLKGRIGRAIGSEKLTIVEDPFLESGFRTCRFDDEGFPTRSKTIIEKGVLKEYLFNSRAANKEGIVSTGNGFRDSYKAPVGTRPTNIMVLPGIISRESMIESIDMGLYITDVAGLHSGLNPVSGDFSLQAQGFLIENGHLKRPVNGITVSGNFIEMLSNICAVSDDIYFGFPGNGHYGAPSIKINLVDIAGY